MRRLIKFLAFVMVVAVFGIAGLWATGSDEPSGDEGTVHLVFWGGLPPEKGPQELVDNYMSENPNVSIDYVRYVNDDEGNVKLDTALLAGEKIDIFTSYGSARREQRVGAGMAADITEYCRKYDIDLVRDFGEGALPSIVDGRVYSIPTMKIVGFMAVNKDMFDAAGIEVPTEWTWDQFRDVAKRLTRGSGADKVYGVIRDVEGLTPMALMATAYNQDAYLKDDMSGTLWLENPDFRRAFQLLHDMMYEDESLMAYEDMMAQQFTDSGTIAAAFFQGRSAMMATGTYMLRNLKDAEKYPRDFEVAFAPVPTFDTGSGRYYREVWIYDDMMVNPASQYADEAVQFLKWYATDGYDPMIVGGRIPLYLDYPADRAASLLLEGAGDLLDQQSFVNNVLSPAEYVQEAKPGASARGAELQKIFLEEREKYYLGVTTIDELLENLTTRQNEVLSR